MISLGVGKGRCTWVERWAGVGDEGGCRGGGKGGSWEESFV